MRSLPLNIWRAVKQKRMRPVLCIFKGTKTTRHICIIHSRNSHILSLKLPRVVAIKTQESVTRRGESPCPTHTFQKQYGQTSTPIILITYSINSTKLDAICAINLALYEALRFKDQTKLLLRNLQSSGRDVGSRDREIYLNYMVDPM